MRILTKLLANTSKKQPVVTSKIDNSLVKEISSDDGIKFDAEGIPYEYTLDIHQITKKNFTPAYIYNDPPAYPWAEANKHKKVDPAVQQSPTSTQQVTQSLPQVTSCNEILVYNGYPLKFSVNDSKTVIAINNRGDSIFQIDNTYILRCVSEDQVVGKFLEVLDCNLYTKETIEASQGTVWYV